MRARLFHIDVFSGLASPNGHQRVPMIGRGNGDGVNFFVLEELANINIGFWLWQTHLLDVIEALVQYVFIDIAQSGELRSGNTRKAARSEERRVGKEGRSRWTARQ